MASRLPSDSEIEHLSAELSKLGRSGCQAVQVIAALQERLDNFVPRALSDREVAGHLAKLSGDFLDAALGLRSSPRD